MNTDTDIWFAFARTFGMLFVVLAVFFLAFYLFRRFSGMGTGKGADNLIQVLAIHHISPKEKLVLVSVQNQGVLVGVSPSGMSKLADLDHVPEQGPKGAAGDSGFSRTLGKAMKQWSGKPGAVSGDKVISHE